MKKNCLFLILLAPFLVVSQSTSVQEKNVIIGDTANMDCFIPSLANQFEDLYVDLMFLSSVPGYKEIKIGSYKLNPIGYNLIEDSYKSRLEFLSNGEVKLTFVGLPDEGTYSCHPRAYGIPSGLEKATAITVFVPPKIEVKAVNSPLVAGSPVTDAAECIADGGKPSAQVHWTTTSKLTFSETVVSDNSSSQLATITSTLHIEPIKYYNGQPFSCIVKHPAFPSDNITSIHLNVTYKPESLKIKVDKKKNQLTCYADGNPPVTYTWIVPEGAPQKRMNGPTVDLVNPSDPLHGNDTYMCTVSNGVGDPLSKNITTYVAINLVPTTSQASVAPIVGGVIGGLIALCIIVLLIYFFIIKKKRNDKDNVMSHQPSTVNYNTEGYTRPSIQHANDSLNKQRPPSPAAPPPEENDGHSPSSSDSEDHGDVNHENDPSLALVDPASQETPESGITSRSSMNFRLSWNPYLNEARRKRPSSSPAYRKSKTDHQMQRQDRSGESPAPATRNTDRYDMPPGDSYDDGMDIPNQHLGVDDYPEEGYHDDGYPMQQPQYVRYPPQQSYRDDSLPPYEPSYTELDHSAYGKGSGARNPPHEEPVEYAQIRHGYSHVV